MKRKICLLLVLIVIVSSLFGCKPKETYDVDFYVDIPSGREPRILILADTQIIHSEQQRSSDRLVKSQYDRWLSTSEEENWMYCVRETIKEYNPDFIFTVGDNVYGEFDDTGAAFTSFVSYMDSFNIPWSIVFGNHDNESKMGVDWQCEQLINANNCLFKQRTLTGNGNYTVGIRQDGKLLRVFFMTDSNQCGNMSEESLANGHSTTASGLQEDQIEWVKKTSENIKENNPDVKYSIVFHVPIRAYMNALTAIGLDKVNGYNFDLKKKNNDYLGYYDRLSNGWDPNEEFFETIKLLGFDSVFCGHIHENSFSLIYEDVRLTYGQKSSAYDSISYIVNGNETKYEKSYDRIGTPVWGGTGMTIDSDGAISDIGLVLVADNLATDN